MIQRSFNTAGWIAILSAVLTVPLLVVSVVAGLLPDNVPLKVLGNVLSVGTSALAI